jgi:GT2 family glycosyltransferase
MNNDILVAPDFAIRLIDFAKSHNLKIVSPARIDGDNDYNFHDFAIYAQNKMADALRLGSSNAVCMCIHWSVFNQIGFFRANPNLLGFEDGLFYNDVRKHDIKHATTGSVWIHHFGRVTQDHLKASLGLKEDDLLVKVNDRKLYDQSFFQRKLFRYRMKKSYKQWRSEELHKYKMTLQGISINNDLVWI